MPDAARNHAALGLVRAWPFEEAQKVVRRAAATDKRGILFETGYGPSGLPHIGTFGEVARTTWVRHAFTSLTGLPSRLIAFSDDMDGLRKVPENIPNPDLLTRHLGKPLTAIPDPFGTHESFGSHNNSRLRAFLDRFGFEYEFASATEYYRSGRFDTALLRVLEVYEEVRSLILPTLGPERRATYSPVLPIHPKTGQVMQVGIERVDRDASTVIWRDPDTAEWHETPVTGGRAKLQWKADWAMRWHALRIDYEMSGKDLLDSVRLSGRICRILGSDPPESFTYELFLDENGQKISKSKGNGLAVEDWLRYAPAESLAQFMYNSPQRAKRLYFDVIPRAVDEYLVNLERAQHESAKELPENPVWHIHGGHPPTHGGSPISFAMLLNLASVVNAETPDILWSFIRRYAPAATPNSMPFLAQLVDHAIVYYRDFIQPAKRFRAPIPEEQMALADLAATLAALPPQQPAEAIQNAVYEVGKRHAFPDLRTWFVTLYQVLLGQKDGPRFGNFVAIYGVPETIALIESALSRAAAG